MRRAAGRKRGAGGEGGERWRALIATRAGPRIAEKLYQVIGEHQVHGDIGILGLQQVQASRNRAQRGQEEQDAGHGQSAI